MKLRTGLGYDLHRLVEGRELWLCGLKIEHTHGLLGHSDADAPLHALCDALLGAAGLRDIGYYFPDTASEWEGADSKLLLARVVDMLTERGWHVGNVDITIVAEAPKLNPHIPAMKRIVAPILGLDEDEVSIKATTNEDLGPVGQREAICALATCLITE